MARNGQLIEAHVPSLRRYARALTGDRDRADELVHDCVVRAMSRWHLWRRPSNLRAWLFTILHNIHVNDVQRAARAPQLVEWNDQLGGSTMNPSQISSLQLRDIARGLSQLSREQREVLLLVGLEGFTYEEAASITGVPIGTVMSRLARGRDRLKALATEADEAALRRAK